MAIRLFPPKPYLSWKHVVKSNDLFVDRTPQSSASQKGILGSVYQRRITIEEEGKDYGRERKKEILKGGEREAFEQLRLIFHSNGTSWPRSLSAGVSQ